MNKDRGTQTHKSTIRCAQKNAVPQKQHRLKKNTDIQRQTQTYIDIN